MQETTRDGAHSQENNEALNACDEGDWEAQEAINRAAIAKKHGFKPCGGFAPSVPSKTPPLSKAEQEKDKARRAKALQAWLDEALPKTVTEKIAPDQSPVASGGLDDVIQSIKDGCLSEVPEPTEPQTAPTPVANAVESVRQRGPRRPMAPRTMPHGNSMGVWIPREVWEDSKFESTDERILYLEVNHLDRENGCTATNRHFATYLGCSIQTIRDMIQEMTERGIFTCRYPSRRSRIIHVVGGRQDYSRHRF